MGAAKRFTQNPGSNAICYYRYSSGAQRDVSIDQQREAAQEYAKAHGYHIIKEYEDHAISGTSDERPQFQQMLYEVEKLRPAYLILWKTDRLSRDRIDAVLAKKRLREYGVKISYVAEAIPDDDEATQILMESIYEAMAASFIVSHRKNVMRGLTYNAENALYNGNKMLGYTGQPDQKYEIDDDTAPIVRRIFQEYAEGVPMQRICDGLNGTGQRTVRGNPFTVNSLRNILMNRAYIGEYRYGEIVIPGGMPRLVDDAVFLAAQARLDANKRGGKGAVKKIHPEAPIDDYGLTGKIYCGLCGGTLHGISGTNKKGKLYYYYACINHTKHTCSLKNQRKELIEAIVLYVLYDLLHDSAYRIIISNACYEYHMRQNDDNGAYEESLKARLKEVEGKLANIIKAIEKGIFGDTMAQQMQALESQKSILNDALLAERNRKKFALKRSDILRFLDSFAGDLDNPETRQRLLDSLIDKIYVYPDRLVITFHYSDDRRELPFEEMEQLLANSRTIESMLGEYREAPTEATAKMRESLLGESDKSEKGESPDFFS